MLDLLTIRILETEPNKVGDLFARLMKDLFMALGYDQPRVNIQRTGREMRWTPSVGQHIDYIKRGTCCPQRYC